MWFKNIQAYRLPANWAYTAAQLEAALAPQSFVPCGANELLRQGWASPRENDQLVHVVHGQWLLKLMTEKKLLPTSVINQVAKERAAELEEQQGFAPGRKAMKELKERVADELLPRAFPIRRATHVWIDPVNGWLVVDAATASAADDAIKMLLKCVDRMPLESVRVARSPVAVMTAWLDTDEAPAGFTVDRDAIMRSTGESKASVRYVKHTLEVDDIRRHIAAGKQCTRLGMTWNDKISFVLTENLSIKSIQPLDVIKENDASTRNDEERFDNDMVLMTGELAKLLADVMGALGGEVGDLVSPPRAPAAPQAAGAALTSADSADDDTEMYDKAVAVVLAQRRVSISLVQRHLLVGYNRAARLIETMEKLGVVGPMMSNGDRQILTLAA
jgi:recombination associated protein RdgC